MPSGKKKSAKKPAKKPSLADEDIPQFLKDCHPMIPFMWLDTQQFGRGVFRGFQRTEKNLSKSLVRKRLTNALGQHPEAKESLVDLWCSQAEELVEKVRSLRGKKLTTALPELKDEFGENNVNIALLLCGKSKTQTKPANSESKKKTSKKSKTTDEDKEYIEFLKKELDTKQEGLVRTWTELVEADEQLEKLRHDSEHQLETEKKRHKQHEEQLNQTLKRKTAQAEKAIKAADEKAHEMDKRAGREERRAKKALKELGEQNSVNKRLRRQLRQGQRIAEDLRKQLTLLQKQLPEEPQQQRQLAEPKPQKSPSPKKRISPEDQPFHFELDGNRLEISARQTVLAAKRNDENLIFTLTQILFHLREINPKAQRLFLDRVRTVDPFTARILTGDTTRVLVDASNVARFEKNKYGKGSLENLLALRDELRSRSYFPIILIADASLPYFIDDPHKLRKMVKEGNIQMTNKGEEADEYLARQAQRTGAYVVTNDRKFHLKSTADFEPMRIGFTIKDGAVYLHEY